jgi:hypothetical protein
MSLVIVNTSYLNTYRDNNFTITLCKSSRLGVTQFSIHEEYISTKWFRPILLPEKV